MSLTFAMGGVIALKKLVEEMSKDIYTSIKHSYVDKLKRIEAFENVDSLYTKIGDVSKVKTIWQIDKSVDLKSFYCDSYIFHNDVRKVINSISDIGIDGNILIEGIAGQGKSILMRYLCMKELEFGRYIPVFIELRKLLDGQKISDLIYLKLKELGFDIDDYIFKVLCQSEKMLFLLDGFDEIKDGMQKQTINEIEEIANTLYGIKIIISSRPNSGLEFLPSFNVAKIDYIRGDEYKKIINKLSDDAITTDNLLKQIDNHKNDIKELLCTPLMVTLLVLTYKAYQKIPDQLSEFYESLFHLLLQRHDGTKPGYTRERKCNLNDIQYQRVFEAVCYVSKNISQSFDLQTLYAITEKALDITIIKEDPQKFIYDINRITCLILHEGKEYRFIHKSLQEYFAASFIKYKPNSVAAKFYSSLLAENYKWAQELYFLEEIDKFRFYKYFYIPLTANILNITGKKIPVKITNKYLDNLLNNIYVYKFPDHKEVFYGITNNLNMLVQAKSIKQEARGMIYHKLYTSRDLKANFNTIVEFIKTQKPDVDLTYSTSLLKLLNNNICSEPIRHISIEIYDSLHSYALAMQTYLKLEEKADFLTDPLFK